MAAQPRPAQGLAGAVELAPVGGKRAPSPRSSESSALDIVSPLLCDLRAFALQTRRFVFCLAGLVDQANNEE